MQKITYCNKCNSIIKKFGDVFSWGQISVQFKKILVGLPYCKKCSPSSSNKLISIFYLNKDTKIEMPLRIIFDFNGSIENIENIRKVMNLINITISKECSLSWYSVLKIINTIN